MQLKLNIAANFFGRGYATIVSLICVPFYIKFLGVESYGLIGIYVMLMGILTVFDLGLSTTLNRLMASFSVDKTTASELRDLVRTYEFIYWGVGIFIGSCIFLISPWLVDIWAGRNSVSKNDFINCLKLISIIFIFQWPVSLYSGGLMGLERQVQLNVIRSATLSLQSVGAVLVIWLISPKIESFFYWQIFASIIQVLLLKKFLSESIRGDKQYVAKFNIKWITNNWKFSFGTMAIAFLSTILMQSDKLLVSHKFNLEIFGNYTLAFVISNIIGALAGPIYLAIFPRFTKLISEGREDALINLYHNSVQLLSIIIVPIGISLIFFPYDIVLLWLNDKSVVDDIYQLVRIITIGTILNSILILPFALQLASGWTLLSIYKNIFAVIFYIPALFFLINYYGIFGAAFTWLLLNLFYIIFELPIMHKKMLRNEMWRWYKNAIFIPFGVSITISFFVKVSINNDFISRFNFLISLIIQFIVLALCFPSTRKYVLLILKK